MFRKKKHPHQPPDTTPGYKKCRKPRHHYSAWGIDRTALGVYADKKPAEGSRTYGTGGKQDAHAKINDNFLKKLDGAGGKKTDGTKEDRGDESEFGADDEDWNKDTAGKKRNGDKEIDSSASACKDSAEELDNFSDTDASPISSASPRKPVRKEKKRASDGDGGRSPNRKPHADDRRPFEKRLDKTRSPPGRWKQRPVGGDGANVPPKQKRRPQGVYNYGDRPPLNMSTKPRDSASARRIPLYGAGKDGENERVTSWTPAGSETVCCAIM